MSIGPQGADPLQALHEAEQRLQRTLGPRASLDPGRATATPLPVLGERMCERVQDPRARLALGAGLARIALAQLEHFPGSLFWDLDFVATSMARSALRDPLDAPRRIARYAGVMEELNAAYGLHSPIRFRYVHDFIYGFDWERWVRADPPARAEIGPFDDAFLQRGIVRSRELVQLIAEHDPAYPPLEPGRFRNPFAFSREPDDEWRLHRLLFAEGGIPVHCWDADARPDFSRPYSNLRRKRALRSAG